MSALPEKTAPNPRWRTTVANRIEMAVRRLRSSVDLLGFRPVRIPVALRSARIIFSTLTTGRHYFSDVHGGIAVAVAPMAVARACAVSRDASALL